jgi:hypothetical protein
MNPTEIISPAQNSSQKKYSSKSVVLGGCGFVFLLLATSSPHWLLNALPVSGETWPISVRVALPGYEWTPVELEPVVQEHYKGADLVSGVFRAPDGVEISAFAATWITGKGPDLVFGPHTPDVCYPAQGGVCLERKADLHHIDVSGKKIPFGRRVYQLRNGQQVLIYFANLIGGSTFLEVGDRIWTRFAMALRTRTDKRREQAYLLVTTPVIPSLEEANKRLLNFIPAWIDVTGTHGRHPDTTNLLSNSFQN